MDKIIDRPDKTHFFASVNSKTNMNDNRKKKKSKVSTIQRKYFSKESGITSSEKEDLDKYVRKVAKAYHSERRREWEKAYQENYKTRYFKGDKYPAKI